MRIAFTGAGGTGKTTLATYVAEKWGIPFLGNTARDVMKEMGVENEAAQANLSPETVLALQQGIFERFKDLRRLTPSFVSDRLLLDNYTYSTLRCNETMTPEIHKPWLEAAVSDLYNMDLVFYCPAGMFPLKGDGIRQEGIAHHYLFDAAVYGHLCRHAFDKMLTNVYVVNMTDLDRRKHYVDGLISEVYSNVRA